MAEAKKKLEEIKEKLAGYKVENHIRSLAEDEDVSLIAMSYHGKSWLREMLVGDTTLDVVKTVLVIRAK